MRVTADPAAGRAVTFGGKAYAAFWIAVVAARVYFTYGAQHVFSAQLGQWLYASRARRVSAGAGAGQTATARVPVPAGIR